MPPKRPSTRGNRSATADSQNNDVQQQSTITSSDTPTEQNGTTEAARSASASSSIKRLDTLQANPLGSTNTRGRGTAGRAIARPRGIGRRSQQGRAELEKAEQERKQAEAANQARESAWRQRRDLARARGSTRGRVRGGYAGEIARSSAQVSGPFSMGEIAKDRGSKRPNYSGTGGASGSGSGSRGGGRSEGNAGLKREHGDAIMSDVHIKQEDGGYISSDEDDTEGQKFDVDALIDLTGEDDEDVQFLPPVRIQRVEHKERTLASATETSTNASKSRAATSPTDRRRGKAKSKDVEITGETQRYKGTYTDSSSEDEGMIKAEPTDESRLPDLQSPPTSPEMRKRAKEKIRLDGDTDVHKPSFQTKEEELEWDIHERDLQVLRTELGQMKLPASATDGAEVDPRADKVYLFQLPAVLPGLVPVVPKAEEADVSMLDVPEHDDGVVQKASKKASIVHDREALPSGLVGKLRVHASGKAYLDWGGIPMEVSMGQEAFFLQEVLVLDTIDANRKAGDDKTDDVAGMAMSMGQVKGKFVVVPEWDKIFDEAA